MSEFQGKLLPQQYEFVNDFEYRELLYCGGFGAGKSVAAACKALKLAAANPGYSGAILSPTYGMLVDTLMPTFEEVLTNRRVKFTYRASPQPYYLLHFRKGTSKVFCRSAENYRRLASLNLAWAVLDEGDTLNMEDCISAWKMLQSRLRTGKFRQLCMTTTPEGFSGAYHLFVKDEKNLEFRKRYKVRTYDNHHLPQDYIDNLLSSYSPQEIEAYLNGEFTNLKSGTVYFGYDRKENNTDLRAEDFIIKHKNREIRPILHIGCDFNVGQTSGIVCIVKKNEYKEQCIYVVDEFTERRDTDDLIDAIKERYPDYPIMMYPDSSGKNSNTATTVTDIALLRKAFGGENVKFPRANPRIMNRVKSVNARILNGKGERHLFVNTTYCPTLTACLEQQAYDKAGKPEKVGNIDHPIDALGYAVHFMFPIVARPSVRNLR